MFDKNSFIPFHHYDFKTIANMADMLNIQLIQHGDAIGEQFLTLKNEEKNVSFSFVSVGKNDEGIVYICVFNGQPYTARQYEIIRTHNDDYLVHVNHQYDHYDPNKQYIGKLSYHLYQLAKNTLNNEKIIMAYGTLDALDAFGDNGLNVQA